ncbi:hypothetical protein GCM10009016_18290 [Halomonas beimenensis]
MTFNEKALPWLSKTSVNQPESREELIGDPRVTNGNSHDRRGDGRQGIDPASVHAGLIAAQGGAAAGSRAGASPRHTSRFTHLAGVARTTIK